TQGSPDIGGQGSCIILGDQPARVQPQEYGREEQHDERERDRKPVEAADPPGIRITITLQMERLSHHGLSGSRHLIDIGLVGAVPRHRSCKCGKGPMLPLSHARTIPSNSSIVYASSVDPGSAVLVLVMTA